MGRSIITKARYHYPRASGVNMDRESKRELGGKWNSGKFRCCHENICGDP
jgi:hypothetical protein